MSEADDAKLRDCQKECATLHDEKMMLVRLVSELQNDIFKLHDVVRRADDTTNEAPHA